jgi:hypothetical protein
MEGEFLVAEPVHLLDDQGTKHLFGGQAVPPGVHLLDVANQISINEVDNDGIGVKDVADNLEFCGVFVVDKRVDNRQLVV